MAVLEKKKSENNGVNIDVMSQRVKDVKSVMNGNAQEIKTEKPDTTPEASNNETNITFRISEQDKVNYKTFFASQNVSLSFGIKLAIEHLILDVKAGKGTIKKTGYFEY